MWNKTHCPWPRKEIITSGHLSPLPMSSQQQRAVLFLLSFLFSFFRQFYHIRPWWSWTYDPSVLASLMVELQAGATTPDSCGFLILPRSTAVATSLPCCQPLRVLPTIQTDTARARSPANPAHHPFLSPFHRPCKCCTNQWNDFTQWSTVPTSSCGLVISNVCPILFPSAYLCIKSQTLNPSRLILIWNPLLPSLPYLFPL